MEKKEFIKEDTFEGKKFIHYFYRLNITSIIFIFEIFQIN